MVVDWVVGIWSRLGHTVAHILNDSDAWPEALPIFWLTGLKGC